MTPYQAKITKSFLQLTIGGIVASISVYVADLTKLFEQVGIDNLPVKIIVGLLIALLWTAVSYYLWYRLQVHALYESAGVYIPVARLRRIDSYLSMVFGLIPYNPYYAPRPEDDAIRMLLQKREHVLVLGEPLAGKTRTALEAIIAINPTAYLLWFTNTDKITQNHDNLVVPGSWWNPCHRPEVVLFIDDLAQFATKSLPFPVLLLRLSQQVAHLWVSATCCSGHDEVKAYGESWVVDTFKKKVTLDPLDEQVADALYQRIWGHGSVPILDMRLAGAIVIGREAMLNRYRGLKPHHRRVMTALGLARICGASPCEKDFLERIWSTVLNQKVSKADETLETIIQGLVDEHFLVVGQRGHVGFRRDFWMTEDFNSYYVHVPEIVRDLQALESLLVKNKASRRLAEFGVYYATTRKDFEAARRLLNRSLSFSKKEPLVHLRLAQIYVNLRNLPEADKHFQECLGLIADNNGKSLALISYGDWFLYRQSNIQSNLDKATELYQQALQTATDENLRRQARFRSGECLLANGKYPDARRIYEEGFQIAPVEERTIVGCRLILAMIATGQAQRAYDQLQSLWRDQGLAERLKAVSNLLLNAERLFLLGNPPLCQQAYDFCSRAFRDAARSEAAEGQVDWLLAYSDKVCNDGFLPAAVDGYKYLIENADGLKLKKVQVVLCHGALGAVFRDQQNVAAARSEFETALLFSRQDREVEWYSGYAVAGLADCDLWENHVSEAKKRYDEALETATKKQDLCMEAWANLGLGDIALMKQDFAEAERTYRSLPWLDLNSVCWMSRFLLGLVRACIGQGKYDDAEYHMYRGMEMCVPDSYRFRRLQFEQEKQRVDQALKLRK